jgi:predicted RNA-binding protein
LINACDDLPPYDGSVVLNVGSAEALSFQGGKQLDAIINEGFLLLCGSWTVSDQVTVAPDAVLRLFGTMAIGTNQERGALTVGRGALLQIEGNVTIYGDLILEDGARVEFLGDSSVIDIFGDVSSGRGSTVAGKFRDVRNKIAD